MVLIIATIYCMIQAWVLAAPVLALAVPFLPVVVALQVVGFVAVWRSFAGSPQPRPRHPAGDKVVRVHQADRRRRLSVFDRVQEASLDPFISRSTDEIVASSSCKLSSSEFWSPHNSTRSGQPNL